MIKIKNKEKCCGCHACVNICPQKAIRMQEDEKGFKYPVVDKEKCIECRLCEKVCPMLKNTINNYEKKVYAAMNKNKNERINSSSGGIFSLLAKEILNRKGIVFGAAFDKDFNVNHVYIDDIKDINKLQGSKYVQSNINDSYKKVKEYLNKDKFVLFTGTSCQIEGLKSYLMKDYEKLYTQDIICHGVPSPKVWQKYLEYQKKLNKENIKSISFRNKDHGWNLYQTKILFDTKTYSNEHSKDLFMQAFLKNSCLRESCYNCHFKNNYRNSDITLADFWGIKKFHPNMNDDKGTSAIIINSQKGEELFNVIKDDCIYVKSKIKYIHMYNSAYIKSVSKDKKYPELYDNLDIENFDVLVDKHISKIQLHKKIIIKIKSIVKKVLVYLKVIS